MPEQDTKQTPPFPDLPESSQPVELTMEQKIRALHFACNFFSQFDRVPGFAAIQWGQALDAVVVTLNSLILEHKKTLEPKE